MTEQKKYDVEKLADRTQRYLDGLLNRGRISKEEHKLATALKREKDAQSTFAFNNFVSSIEPPFDPSKTDGVTTLDDYLKSGQPLGDLLEKPPSSEEGNHKESKQEAAARYRDQQKKLDALARKGLSLSIEDKIMREKSAITDKNKGADGNGCRSLFDRIFDETVRDLPQTPPKGRRHRRSAEKTNSR